MKYIMELNDDVSAVLRSLIDALENRADSLEYELRLINRRSFDAFIELSVFLRHIQCFCKIIWPLLMIVILVYIIIGVLIWLL